MSGDTPSPGLPGNDMFDNPSPLETSSNSSNVSLLGDCTYFDDWVLSDPEAFSPDDASFESARPNPQTPTLTPRPNNAGRSGFDDSYPIPLDCANGLPCLPNSAFWPACVDPAQLDYRLLYNQIQVADEDHFTSRSLLVGPDISNNEYLLPAIPIYAQATSHRTSKRQAEMSKDTRDTVDHATSPGSVVGKSVLADMHPTISHDLAQAVSTDPSFLLSRNMSGNENDPSSGSAPRPIQHQHNKLKDKFKINPPRKHITKGIRTKKLKISSQTVDEYISHTYNDLSVCPVCRIFKKKGRNISDFHRHIARHGPPTITCKGVPIGDAHLYERITEGSTIFLAEDGEVRIANGHTAMPILSSAPGPP
ncbi:hypothetical protein DXG01_006420 [Tephrocybe rancida]|nr:hypothetical protein DXG01_006420 [Tephrocybe rancida]